MTGTSIAREPRPVALTTVLCVVIALTLVGGLDAIRQRDELMLEFPRRSLGVWIAYIAVPVPAIASEISMLCWRRWGFWLTCVVGLVMARIEIFAGMVLKTLRVSVVIFAIALLARPHWRRFR
jgi:hypothetical protein